ncbi:MAG: YifB family Mg chelatase-like AAA ATPase [Fibrobacter sp.]|nr:YifB family Mg chelatase-like AAA ATPase [Fibrobacter sp.]
MFQRIRTFCLSGIQAIPVNVEVDVSQGLPGFTLVGLPDSAVRESRERVIAAVRSSGYAVTGNRMTVSLSPADLKKEGAALDLPIAIGMLLASKEISVERAERYIFLGELALDGELKPVRGVLSVAMNLKKTGADILVVPRANEEEASLVEGITVLGVSTLSECIRFLESAENLSFRRASGFSKVRRKTSRNVPDFKSVLGMKSVKRALEIAAAGGHNFLLIGSPGSGKTFCARCLPGILPEMDDDEILETTRIHSCAGFSPPGSVRLIEERPFRTPHHSASMGALIGGGVRLSPGEVSLAHNGVLFLDELPEYQKNVLEGLREPMEERKIQISRVSGTVVWPASFMLGAAMNPCPCGYSMDPERECRCLPDSITRYRQRISGPLMDRIDLQIMVPPVRTEVLRGQNTEETSAVIRERVMKARTTQKIRFKKWNCGSVRCNADMDSEQARLLAFMNDSAAEFSVQAAQKMNLSARGYYRLLKVSRTIADLRDSGPVEIQDMSEALRYREFSFKRPV